LADEPTVLAGFRSTNGIPRALVPTMRAGAHGAHFREPRWIAGAVVRPYDRARRLNPCCRSALGGRAGASRVMLALAWKSLRNRRFIAALAVISIALAVALLIGVERIRDQSRESFASTI